MDVKEYLSVGEASKLCGICPKTLRKITDENKVDFYRTPSGNRKISRLSLSKLCNIIYVDNKVSKDKKINFIYSRVSSKKQQDDLDRQLDYLKTRKPEYSTYTPIKDVGSGLNFKRKGLQLILDSCVQGNVGDVVVAHRDRLSRFGFDLIEIVVEKSGGKITVIDDEHHKSTEQELSEDLLSIVQIYCCRSMGKRRYSKVNKDSSKSEQEPKENI
jgi:predicted site-specific integrase-resolvase